MSRSGRPAHQHDLFEHRTEPLVVDLLVDESLVDRGAWGSYDEALQVLARRFEAIGLPGGPGEPVVLGTDDP